MVAVGEREGRQVAYVSRRNPKWLESTGVERRVRVELWKENGSPFFYRHHHHRRPTTMSDREAVPNPTDEELTLPKATVQKLINGESSSFLPFCAASGVGRYGWSLLIGTT